MSESAFPITANGFVLAGGMTLRDYFAAKALPAILEKEYLELSFDEIAEQAYEVADSMIAWREE